MPIHERSYKLADAPDAACGQRNRVAFEEDFTNSAKPTSSSAEDEEIRSDDDSVDSVKSTDPCLPHPTPPRPPHLSTHIWEAVSDVSPFLGRWVGRQVGGGALGCPREGFYDVCRPRSITISIHLERQND